ncbi:MAG: TonB-dependent receptor [Geothrix sp.]|uniref:TonB-dependent receptor n=1 Tax=Geothrix sp. TaxID=1962974 RepID=UPI0018018F62|nr:TonB-dependent receptor [Geothrix sp.]NWJ41940.1 TonB-dependent receptor [Geothrix sp.]WIL20087.1 MAG: TonB-dependent receptor [Geothrix sp.]
MARNAGSFRFSALVLALVACPVALLAQSNTTAALTGVVKDPKGAPLAGATVRVSSASQIGGERVVRTADNGIYRVPLLAPGRYRIVVEALGLTTIVSNETLELGKTTTLNWKFASAASATVEVVAAAAELTTVGITQNYSTEDLATLPVERSMSGIMNLTPGVNGKAAWGGDTGENAWLMDGMNIGDVSGGGQWLYANPDWFSEVQVGGIGASAEYGNFNGGYTNALVKRGGNNFSGSLNFYYADSAWEAKTSNRYPGLDRTILPGKSFDGAINLGGPIIKDKLWFFASAWASQSETTPIGALASQKRSYQNLLAKITWQVTPDATLETLLEYDSLPEENKGIDNTVLPIASHKQIAPDRLFNVIWTQSLNTSMVLTSKVSGYSGNYEGRPNNGNMPSLNAEGSLLTTAGDPSPLDYFGNNQWYRNNYRARIEGAITLDYFKTSLFNSGDSHAFRFGFEQAQATNEDLKTPTAGYQLYAYEYGSNANGFLTPDLIDVGGGYNIKMHSNRSALYVQDTWAINDRVTLRPGLRLEKYTARGYGETSNIWDKKVVAPRFGGTIALTQDQKNVLKFHWGKYYTAFSSWFVDRAYQSWTPVMTEYYWQGNDFNPLTTPPSQYTDPAQGRTPDFSAGNISYSSNNISPVDPNAKQPYTEETTFSFEHKFEGPWSTSATWVYRKQKDILVRLNKAEVTTGPNATGSWETDTGYYTNHGAPQDLTWWNSNVDPNNPNGTNWLVATEPTAKRNYLAATLVIDRKWMDDWSLNASFTRARRYGNMSTADGYDGWAPYESPNYMINANGLLPGYNDYEGKVRGAIKLPWIMKLSFNFTYLSGQRYTPYVRTYRNDAGVRSYVFVEARGSEKYPSEHLLDIRLSKNIKFGKKADLEVFGQVFNVLNTGTTLSYSTERINSSAYGIPGSVEQGRRLQLGARLSF